MAAGDNLEVSKSTVAINAVSSVTSRILSMALLFWLFQFLAKRVPPDEFAVYPVVMAIIAVAPTFFMFLTGGLSRNVVNAYARGERELVTRIVSSIWPVMAGAGGVAVVVGVAFAFHIEQFLNVPDHMVAEARLMLLLLIGALTLEMLVTPFATAYHVRQRYVELNLLQVAREVVRAAVTIGLLVGVEPRVLWVVVGTVIADGLMQLIILVRARQMAPELRIAPRLFNYGVAKSQLNFGLWTAIGQIGGLLSQNLTVVALNLFSSPVAVSAFFIGSVFYQRMQSLIFKALDPLHPALAIVHAHGEKERFKRIVLNIGRYATWMSMAISTPMIIYSHEFIGLYLGDQYAVTAIVLLLFMAMGPFNHPTILLGIASVAAAELKKYFLPAFLVNVLTVAVVFLMLIRFEAGAIGAAVAVVGVNILGQVGYFWWRFLNLIGASWSDFLQRVMIPGLAPAVGGAVVWMALKLAYPVTGWVHLGVYSALGGAAYLVVLIGFCLDESDRRDLETLMTKLGLGRFAWIARVRGLTG